MLFVADLVGGSDSSTIAPSPELDRRSTTHYAV